MYRHTQIGWPIIAPTFIVVPVLMLVLSGSADISLPLLIAAAVTLTFGWLTVTVDERRVSWHFGVGLIRKSLPTSAIKSFRAVRNPWYYGWGIRLTPLGWLYNVSGPLAIDLLLEDGRHVQIGTDEPATFSEALRQVAVAPAPPGSVSEHPSSRRNVFLAIVIVNAVVIAAVVWSFYAGTRPPVVTVSPNNVRVRGGGFYSADIPFSSIQEISLQDTIPRVVHKRYGFNAGNALRGRFTLDVLGDAQIFINRGIPPYVVIKTAGSFVIVNFTDPERTRALYEQLRPHMEPR